MLDESNASVAASPNESKAARQRPDPRSKRQGKLDVLRTWKPSVSHPALMVETTIRSVYAQRMLSITFFRAQMSVYQIGVMLPIFTSQEMGNEFENLLGELMGKLKVDLKAEIDRMHQLRDNNGVDVSSIVYPDKEVQAVPLYTPEASTFLGMLQSFDEVLCTADALWLSGVWRRVQRENCINYWRGRMVTFAREINSLQLRARGAMRRAAVHRAAAEAAKEAARQHRRDQIGIEAPAGGAPAAESAESVEGSTPALDAPVMEPANDKVAELKPKRTRSKKAAAEPAALAASA
jgi:hypothetical protein